MNWDISLGHVRQTCGRIAQWAGMRFGNRKLVLAGERAEYAGRLQARYGALKHQVQWGMTPIHVKSEVPRE